MGIFAVCKKCNCTGTGFLDFGEVAYCHIGSAFDLSSYMIGYYFGGQLHKQMVTDSPSEGASIISKCKVAKNI